MTVAIISFYYYLNLFSITLTVNISIFSGGVVRTEKVVRGRGVGKYGEKLVVVKS